MRASSSRLVLFTGAAATIALAGVGAQQQTSSSGGAESMRPDNYYAAGNRIEISSAMPADVVVAGRDIEIRQQVSGDVLAAGWRVAMSGPAGDDVRIAGGEVFLNAAVTGDLTAAGGDVTLGPKTELHGRTWVTGNRVRIEGIADREIRAAGATVQIAGELRQSALIVAERVEILPTARILGPLTYRAPTEASLADGATIVGPIRYEQIPPRDARKARAFPAVSTLLFSIHLLLAGLLVLALPWTAGNSIAETLRRQPGRSFLSGLGLFFVVPPVAALLIVSILALPVGLALAMLYAVALFAGALLTAWFLGQAEARLLKAAPAVTYRERAVVLVAGVVTLALLRALVGWVAVFVAVLFGLGALALWVYQTWSHPPVASASVA